MGALANVSSLARERAATVGAGEVEGHTGVLRF
jgi:hypothetical protein